jgi:hypothetical protein
VVDALRMHVKPALRDSALVLAFEGWNDAGQAASSALRYLNASLRVVPLAEIDPEHFFDFTVRRPELVVEEGRARHIVWPETRFRYGSIDEMREVVTGLGVEPHLRWRAFADCVSALRRELRVERVFLLGAYLADVVYSLPVKVTGFATDAADLEQLGVEGSGYQGPTGIVGVLCDRLQRDGARVVSLWAGLPHYINVSPNPRGALALLEKLAPCLDLKLDDEPLRRSSGEFEQRISDLVAADPEISEYVRQLKRREFAQ